MIDEHLFTDLHDSLALLWTSVNHFMVTSLGTMMLTVGLGDIQNFTILSRPNLAIDDIIVGGGGGEVALAYE